MSVSCLGMGAAGGAALASGTPSDDRADRLAHQLVKEREQHRATVRGLRREVRRLRIRPPSPFTEADTRLAARLVGVVGGWPVAGALRVAWCESRHQPGARNPQALGGPGNYANATGAWQVLYAPSGVPASTWHSTKVGRAIDAPRNPYVNAFVALEVWQRNGRSFAEWKDRCAGLG